MQSISIKIRWMVAILSLNIIIIILVGIWLNADQKLDAKVINTAGKQRMLSQRTVLELHRLLLNEKKAHESLQQVRREFDHNFKQLTAETSDYHGFSDAKIKKMMLTVYDHWNDMGVLIDQYLQRGNNLKDLKVIYEHGDKTLKLMDQAVSQYEQYMMDKRIMAQRIQIVLALISLIVIYNMVRLTLQIQRNFEDFLVHVQTISSAKELSTESKNELQMACDHIEHFLKNVEETLQSAADAVEKSEIATAKLVHISPETNKLLEQSEDVMIQVGEELHLTAKRLNKLKENLQKAYALREM